MIKSKYFVNSSIVYIFLDRIFKPSFIIFNLFKYNNRYLLIETFSCNTLAIQGMKIQDISLYFNHLKITIDILWLKSLGVYRLEGDSRIENQVIESFHDVHKYTVWIKFFMRLRNSKLNNIHMVMIVWKSQYTALQITFYRKIQTKI